MLRIGQQAIIAKFLKSSPPLTKLLLQELRDSFKFKQFLILTRVYLDPLSNGASSSKSKAKKTKVLLLWNGDKSGHRINPTSLILCAFVVMHS
jgi:hypothetical protein